MGYKDAGLYVFDNGNRQMKNTTANTKFMLWLVDSENIRNFIN